MLIEFSHGLLRPWQFEDAGQLVTQANNRRVSQNLRDAFPYPYTADDADRWLAVANKFDPPTNFAIVVVDGRQAALDWCSRTTFIAARPRSATGWAKVTGDAGSRQPRCEPWSIMRLLISTCAASMPASLPGTRPAPGLGKSRLHARREAAKRNYKGWPRDGRIDLRARARCEHER